MIRARTWRSLLKRQSKPRKQRRRSSLQVRKDREAERLRKLGPPSTWTDEQVAERNAAMARALG